MSVKGAKQTKGHWKAAGEATGKATGKATGFCTGTSPGDGETATIKNRDKKSNSPIKRR